VRHNPASERVRFQDSWNASAKAEVGASERSVRILIQNDESEIIPQWRAEAIITVGKWLHVSGQMVAASDVPGDECVPDVDHCHANARSTLSPALAAQQRREWYCLSQNSADLGLSPASQDTRCHRRRAQAIRNQKSSG
jgi:hypothetical protein